MEEINEVFAGIQQALGEKYLAASDEEVRENIERLKKRLGHRVLILTHNYMADDVFIHGDLTGDSLGLSRSAARQDDPRLEYIVFCGVYFMAETADILSPRGSGRKVILPNISAGCSLANMAEYDSAVEAWEIIQAAGAGKVTPITYVNSTAAVKAFVGAHDGACCTSGNAENVLKWALQQGDKVFFLPDQHLGRNTAYRMGIPLEEMVVWDPGLEGGGVTAEELRGARVILWKGHCLVHQKFRPEDIDAVRALYKGIKVIVHPECRFEVASKADVQGSTAVIIKTIESAGSGEKWAVGTEYNLVNRLAAEHRSRGVTVVPLSTSRQAFCVTMAKVSARHLWWTLENLAEGRVVNRVRVEEKTARLAKVAVERMLAL